MNDDWQAEQHRDELLLRRDLVDTLTAATHRPLTEQEAELLAWAAGVRPDYNQEKRA